MNLKWLVAIGLILILVIAPVSAAYHKTNMTRVNTSGCWDRFNMGWLSTPGFKNGGFETGDASFWHQYNMINLTVAAQGQYGYGEPYSGKYSAYIYSIVPDVQGHFYFTQTVNLRSATGITAYTKLGDNIFCDLDGKTATFRINVDDTEVYKKDITDHYEWEKAESSAISYTGRHTVKFDWEFQLGQTGVFYIDEIALVGPGF